MWNAEFKLHLYPTDTHSFFDCNVLNEILSDLKFIGKPISSQPITRYEVGDNFLSLLTFMGCSPNIELDPNKGKPFCYVEIEKSDSPVFLAGKNLKPAKCPYCKNTLKQPSCTTCNKHIEPKSLNWRKTAFISSIWITVGNIYELEAIPNDALLMALEKQTGVKWKVAYIRYNLEDT